MADLHDWDLPRYLARLRCRVLAVWLDRRLRVRFDVSDIVMETMARAVAAPAATIEPDARLGWLERIQDCVLVDKWRECHRQKRDIDCEAFRQQLSQSTGGWEASLAAKQFSPSDLAQQKETMLRIAAAIDQLPERQKEVAIGVLLLGQSLQEVADVLGTTRGTVGGLHARAIRALRLLLEEPGPLRAAPHGAASLP